MSNWELCMCRPCAAVNTELGVEVEGPLDDIQNTTSCTLLPSARGISAYCGGLRGDPKMESVVVARKRIFGTWLCHVLLVAETIRMPHIRLDQDKKTARCSANVTRLVSLPASIHLSNSSRQLYPKCAYLSPHLSRIFARCVPHGLAFTFPVQIVTPGNPCPRGLYPTGVPHWCITSFCSS